MRDEQRSARAAVVVVHGLWMTSAVFALQRARLARNGYHVAAFSYPSAKLPLDDISFRLARFVALLDEPRIHFVGHSLGGLVVLNTLALCPQLPVGRVVLLGAPVGGSLAARRLARSSIGRIVVGRALPDWRVERGVSAAARFEIGMIAGVFRLGVGRFLTELPLPNDGVVCVDETRLPGLRDHLVLPLSHSGMIVSARVARQICSFLESGHFSH